MRSLEYNVQLRLDPHRQRFAATVPGFSFVVHGKTERAAVERARQAVGALVGERTRAVPWPRHVHVLPGPPPRSPAYGS